ncbi:MAG: methyltransferase [Saprospiraceae bacterium]
MNEVFYWKQIPIFQNNEVLKIGTDAILLGSWISHLSLSPRTILDVGSGTGILSLMMADIFPDAQIQAIDNHEKAVMLTNLNFVGSEWSGRLKAFQNDVLVMSESVTTYDLVICNPPYYFNQLIPEDSIRKHSRHTHQHAFKWMKALEHRCNENGGIGMIIPYDLSSAWIHAGNEAGIYCQVRKDVYSFETDQYPIRTLILFGRKLKPLKLDDLYIYETTDRYTKAYRNFTGF